MPGIHKRTPVCVCACNCREAEDSHLYIAQSTSEGLEMVFSIIGGRNWMLSRDKSSLFKRLDTTTHSQLWLGHVIRYEGAHVAWRSYSCIKLHCCLGTKTSKIHNTIQTEWLCKVYRGLVPALNLYLPIYSSCWFFFLLHLLGCSITFPYQ